MPQGGFGRDFQRASVLKTQADQQQRQQERNKIGNEVVSRIKDKLDLEVKRIEKEVILIHEDSMKEIQRAMAKTVKFLLWTSFVSLSIVFFLLGYIL